MVREEFKYEEMKPYLHSNIDVLIIGKPKQEERSKFIYQEWIDSDKTIIILELLNDNNIIDVKIKRKGQDDSCTSGDISLVLTRILAFCNVTTSNILIDLTSLHQVVLMVLIKILLKRVKPKTLFASYVRPQKYNISDDETTEVLTTKISDVKSIPKFTRRERPNPILCSFIGFEGFRYKNILESIDGIKKTRVVAAFPSGSPPTGLIQQCGMQWMNC